MVLSHARSLLASTPEGACDYIQADARDTRTILREAARTLDFGSPVAVLLLGVLHFMPDSDDPYALTASLMDKLVPGSILVVGHGASDIAPAEVAAMTEKYNQHSAVEFIPRSKEQVTRFFTGLEIIAPGIVPVHRWWDADPVKAASAADMAGYTGYAGAGRKALRTAPFPDARA